MGLKQLQGKLLSRKGLASDADFRPARMIDWVVDVKDCGHIITDFLRRQNQLAAEA
jgi:hypothetical protein